MEELSHYIEGSWQFGEGPCLKSSNPATGALLFSGREASAEEVNTAVISARKALASWSRLALPERLAFLERFGKELKQHFGQLSEIISKEIGKPLWESENEVSSMIAKIRISAEAYEERCPQKTAELPLGRLITRHRPHGVAAVFGPFNFPGHLPCGHIIPGLLAGNTIVFKPSELAPLTAKYMAELLENTGLPPGVFNLIQGGRRTGQCLSTHPDIDALFFTGSYETGKLLCEQLAAYPQKILALEMGGNNPLVIWNASDLQTAAYQTIQSAYITSGQRCTCARRLILQKEASGKFLKILIPMIRSLKIGPYTDQPQPFMGSVITPAAAQKLCLKQEELIKMGGKALLKMKVLKESTGLISPGLMDVSSIKQRQDQEIFGPFLQVMTVETFEDAIAEANSTSYGLCAALLSDDEELYQQFLAGVRAGIINWNSPTTGGSSAAPFGGIGRSGNHRPSAYYAADYCSYPIASTELPRLVPPIKPTPGF